MSPVSRRRIAATTVVAVLAGLTTSLAVGTAPASAITNNGTGPLPEAVSADALPTPQTNGIVLTTTIVGDTVYAAGNFTKARPAGVALGGVGEVTRNNVLAFNLVTGELLPWAPDVQGTPFTSTAARDPFCDTVDAVTKTYVCDSVFRIKASPDKTRLYITGDFDTVNGLATPSVAAFDLVTGNLVTTFDAGVTGRVRALDVTNDRIYIGGTFQRVKGQVRTYVAALGHDGSLVPSFAPVLDNDVWAMAASQDGSRVIIGGRFANSNGVSRRAMTSVSAADGSNAPWSVNLPQNNPAEPSFIADLAVSGDTVVAAGIGRGGYPAFEGRLAASVSTGQLLWDDGCFGDTQSLAIANGIIYSTSHSHDCSKSDAYPERATRAFQRFVAQTLDARDTNVLGNPIPSFLHVFPDTDFGPSTSYWKNGTWAIAADSRYVVLGGEFLTVNGAPQQSLTRFITRSQSPKKTGPVAPGPIITAAAVVPGQVRVSVATAWDRDDRTLKYEVFRTGTTAAIDTRFVASDERDNPMFFVNDSQPAGATPTYRVRVSDPDGNAYGSATTVAVTVTSGASPDRYSQSVIRDGAVTFNPLAESTGTTGADVVGGATLTYRQATSTTSGTRNVSTLVVPGPLTGVTNTAINFNGTTDFATATVPTAARSQITAGLETWFRTPTGTSMTRGGTLLALANTTSRTSGTVDRQVSMDNQGRLRFGVTGATTSELRPQIVSSASYNDGLWHHVYASVGEQGMRLFVDGVMVANEPRVTVQNDGRSILRIANESVTAWPNRPTNTNFTGALAQVATYRTELTPTQVLRHVQLRNVSYNELPVARAVLTCGGLECALDAGTSSDSDGSIASVAWDFGAAGLLTGVTNRITFPATGDYPVTVTVTDNDGATATTTAVARVTLIPEFASDTFNRTVTTGWGDALPGGPWQLGTPSSFSVAGGNARIALGTGLTRSSWLPVGRTDADVTFTTSVAALPTSGASIYLSAVARRVDETTAYRARLRVLSDGSVRAQLLRRINSTTDVGVGPEVTIPAVTAANAALIKMRFQAVGTAPTTLRAKVWQATSLEPTAWLLTSTDATPELAVAGGVGITAISSPTNATATTISIREFAGRDPLMNRLPIAAFSSTCVSRACTFDAANSTDPDVPGGLTSLTWDFGDGRTASGPLQSVSFPTDGTYPVTLTVTDVLGGTSTLVRNIEARNAAPTAAFTFSCVARTCSFDATGSVDSDGQIASYTWDLGDGQTATGATPTFSYGTDGDRQVSLTVTDDYGVTKTISKTVSVLNKVPTASFTPSCTGRACTFDAAASADADGSVVGYAWDFGDGTTATGVTTTRTFATPGSYQVQLTVTDDLGTSGSVTVPTIAKNLAPTASFTVDCVGRTCAVDASASTDSDGTVTNYAWGFGDGSTGTGQSASVTYTTGGTRLIALTVTDNNGGQSTVTRDAITTDSAPVAAFTESCTTRTCSFDATASSDLEGAVTYAWAFGDGSTGIGATPSRTYATNGTYDVTLTVTDLAGNKTSLTRSVSAVNQAPVPAIDITCIRLSCNASAIGSTDADGTIASYAWTLGDGRTATGSAPSFSYPADTTVTVGLIVTDNNGDSATASRAVTVTNVIAADDFTRTAATGWGAATSGGTWTTASATSFAANGATGIATAGVGLTRTISLVGPSSTDSEAAVDVSVGALPSTPAATTFIWVSPRRIDDVTNYRARVRIFGDGTVRIAHTVRTAAGEVQVGSDVLVVGLIVKAGDVIRLRTQATGSGTTTLRTKVWLGTGSEPAIWQVTATDTTAALQAAGSAQIAVYQSGANTAAATVRFDNFLLRNLS